MKRFRYWKLTHEEVGKLSYNPDNILNWDIKCTRGKDEDAQFFGVFLYRNGTPHDYETKKGLVYYYNNIERDELPSITQFLKKRYGGDAKEKGERIFLDGSKEIYSGMEISTLAKELEDSLNVTAVITMEIHDTTQDELKKWGFPEAKLLPIPT
ncbi:hypothetical protein OAK01_05210 [Candidatus Nitrosopelagicus sp.]|nr:hypothetical protein [Candidatus Nitrosopelagicus sp.]